MCSSTGVYLAELPRSGMTANPLVELPQPGWTEQRAVRILQRDTFFSMFAPLEER